MVHLRAGFVCPCGVRIRPTHHPTKENTVGLLSGLMKAGIAKKVFDEARKPHNQAKAKELFRSVTNKGSQGGAGRTTPPRP